MTTAVLERRTHQFDVEDIEYLRHGDKPLLARVFRPRGQGPFAALVECHGGAWCLSDRTTERLRHEAMAKNGIVTGLAWTDVGGELLTIEAAMMPGKGRMTVTGNLRDVMKESISAAASYVRMRAVAFGIKPPLFDNRDIHVHVQEGATPKDGPSAGVAMATAIVSVMTGIPVRRDVAMTGEITLRGRVWPIAGLKERLLAALRGGIKTVLIPEENAKDLVEI